MIFRGSVYSPKRSWFSQLLFPIGQIKVLLQKVYNFLLAIIWTELISGKKIESEVANLILFLVFCVTSLVVYYWEFYRFPILIILVSFWLIDCAIAQKDYNYFTQQSSLKLTVKQEKLSVTNNLSNKKETTLDFPRYQVKKIAIAQRIIYSHGFQTDIGRLWQVFLYVEDGIPILMDEQKSFSSTLRKAKRLSSLLNVPIFCLDSQRLRLPQREAPVLTKAPVTVGEGSHPYATEALNLEKVVKCETIKIEKYPRKWHIFSCWRFRDSWLFLQQIIRQSGFFIFVIIMTNLMVKFGEIINQFIASYRGNQPTIINLGNIQQWLTPQLDLASYLEILIALAIVIIQGAKMSQPYSAPDPARIEFEQESGGGFPTVRRRSLRLTVGQTKHIYLDRYSLRYSVSHQKRGEIKTQDIEGVLLMLYPEPSVLLFAEKKAMVIDDLPSLASYRYLVKRLEEGIEHYQT